jgi:hypothetical protein
MPERDEITEEGFGGFRGTWLIGHVRVAEAETVVRHEAEIIRWLDSTANDAQTFEVLATAIEHQDVESLPDSVRTPALDEALKRYILDGGEGGPLGGLEIGVAGLTVALSALRCLTAASCRGHASTRSWSPWPVVFFAAPQWRLERLAELIASEQCGLESTRDMFTVYGASIRDTHRLAKRLLAERAAFRSKASKWHGSRRPRASVEQMTLPIVVR